MCKMLKKNKKCTGKVFINGGGGGGGGGRRRGVVDVVDLPMSLFTLQLIHCAFTFTMSVNLSLFLFRAVGGPAHCRYLTFLAQPRHDEVLSCNIY